MHCLITVCLRHVEGPSLSGAELEKLRVEYHDEIEAMRALCLRVEESQERVRLETDNLRRNEQAVKLQENKILASSEQIELKQVEFQAKGMHLSHSSLPPFSSDCGYLSACRVRGKQTRGTTLRQETRHTRFFMTDFLRAMTILCSSIPSYDRMVSA